MSQDPSKGWRVTKFLPPKYDEKESKVQEGAFISALAAAMNKYGYLEAIIKSELDNLARVRKTANDYSRKNLGTLEKMIWNAIAAGSKGPTY